MNFNKLNTNFYDIFVVAMLLIGLLRGRKRGMSVELFEMLQWLCIVTGAALTYKPVGQFLHSSFLFPLLWTYLASYIMMMVVVKFIFSFIKRVAGEKLIGSDLFGGMEYYLGMMAGLIRFACITLCVLAVLNAKKITDAEHAAQVKADKDLYGETFLPRLGTIQRDVFRHSLFGSLVIDRIPMMLIEPTSDQDVRGGDNSLGKQKERELEEVMGGGRRK